MHMKIVLENLTKIFPSRNKKSGEEVIAVNNFNFTIQFLKQFVQQLQIFFVVKQFKWFADKIFVRLKNTDSALSF